MALEEDFAPMSCECDNGHEQAGTVCLYCWERGWREHADRWPLDKLRLQNAIDFLATEVQRSPLADEAFERIDMLTHFVQRRADQ